MDSKARTLAAIGLVGGFLALAVYTNFNRPNEATSVANAPRTESNPDTQPVDQDPTPEFKEYDWGDGASNSADSAEADEATESTENALTEPAANAPQQVLADDADEMESAEQNMVPMEPKTDPNQPEIVASETTESPVEMPTEEKTEEQSSLAMDESSLEAWIDGDGDGPESETHDVSITELPAETSITSNEDADTPPTTDMVEALPPETGEASPEVELAEETTLAATVDLTVRLPVMGEPPMPKDEVLEIAATDVPELELFPVEEKSTKDFSPSPIDLPSLTYEPEPHLLQDENQAELALNDQPAPTRTEDLVQETPASTLPSILVEEPWESVEEAWPSPEPAAADTENEIVEVPQSDSLTPSQLEVASTISEPVEQAEAAELAIEFPSAPEPLVEDSSEPTFVADEPQATTARPVEVPEAASSDELLADSASAIPEEAAVESATTDVSEQPSATSQTTPIVSSEDAPLPEEPQPQIVEEPQPQIELAQTENAAEQSDLLMPGGEDASEGEAPTVDDTVDELAQNTPAEIADEPNVENDSTFVIRPNLDPLYASLYPYLTWFAETQNDLQTRLIITLRESQERRIQLVKLRYPVNLYRLRFETALLDQINQEAGTTGQLPPIRMRGRSRATNRYVSETSSPQVENQGS